jgi:hypothetical protein
MWIDLNTHPHMELVNLDVGKTQSIGRECPFSNVELIVVFRKPDDLKPPPLRQEVDPGAGWFRTISNVGVIPPILVTEKTRFGSWIIARSPQRTGTYMF